MDIRSRLKTGRIYIDGGYGTSFQSFGLKPGELPELWNLTNPETVSELHREYIRAGCDVITSNTFGANILKFDGTDGNPSLEEIIRAALSNAANAASDFPEREIYKALDVGPTGRLLKPLGDLDFEDAVNVFKETIKLGVKYGADLILIETMNDSYETKAAVLAAKESCSLPVFVSTTYDENGKLMTGASPSAMAALLEGLRVDALGINCGLGPDKMLPIIEELVNNSSTPVMVNPNAGLPVFRHGRTEYEVTPEEFSDTMVQIAKTGASVLGGCCGTTPAHIKALREKTEKLPFKPIEKKNITVISSYTHSVMFDRKPILIGERINPTGKSRFKAALREENYDYILQEGVAQQDAGADVLDEMSGCPKLTRLRF